MSRFNELWASWTTMEKEGKKEKLREAEVGFKAG